MPRVINEAMDVDENRPPTPESNAYDARYLWLNSGLFFVVIVMHWSFKKDGLFCCVAIVDIIFSISMVVPDFDTIINNVDSMGFFFNAWLMCDSS